MNSKKIILIFFFVSLFFTKAAYSLPQCGDYENTISSYKWNNCIGKVVNKARNYATSGSGSIYVDVKAEFYNGKPKIGTINYWVKEINEKYYKGYGTYKGQIILIKRNGNEMYYPHGLGVFRGYLTPYLSQTGRWLNGGFEKEYKYFPDSSSATDYGKGWVCYSGFTELKNKCISIYSLENFRSLNLKFLRSINLI